MKPQRKTKPKRRIKMNGTMKRENFERFEIENNLVSEDCKASGFSMAAVAGGILLCIGIIIYAVLTH